jgi:hypothetical protein
MFRIRFQHDAAGHEIVLEPSYSLARARSFTPVEL